jgi:6-phosphogluconolactonase
VDIECTHIASTYSEKVPHIDIALFGVGLDGHIASLFPHHPLLDSSEYGYLEISDSPKPPAHRITISPAMIRDIDCAFIAFMKGKEEAFAKFQDDGVSVSECPAKMVRDLRNSIILSDIINE